MDTEVVEVVTNAQGAFVTSLQRNNKQIKDDRAAEIGDDAETTYRRRVEDVNTQIKRVTRARNAALDLSPGDKNTLTLAKDFDAEAFADDDIQHSIDLRNLEIKLEIAQSRYKFLFGKEVSL